MGLHIVGTDNRQDPSTPAIEIKPLGPAIGAEISGVDLSRPLPDSQFTAIRRAFVDHGVVFFRDQQLTPEQHIAFAERFGEINVNRFFRAVDGYPMIAEVRKEPEQKKNIGGDWHTDHSYDQIPALGSVLCAHEVPPDGGDTVFASMYAAYDALSDGLKETLGGLRAVHSSRHVFGLGPRQASGDLATAASATPSGDPGRGASGGDPPSRERPQGALRQSRLHAALRRLDRRGVAAAARLSLPPRGAAGVPLPLPLASRARSRSGTTAPPGTTPSTTIRASAA